MKTALRILIFAYVVILSLGQREQGFIPLPRNNLTAGPTVIPIPRLGHEEFKSVLLTPYRPVVTITSTDYPNAYPGGEDRKMIIFSPFGTVIDVVCHDMNLEVSNGCKKDALYISPSGRYDFRDAIGLCGAASCRVTSTSEHITFRFVSNYPQTYHKNDPLRFSCTVSFREASSATVAPVTTAAPTAMTTAAPLTTTSGPFKANSNCTCGAGNEVTHHSF